MSRQPVVVFASSPYNPVLFFQDGAILPSPRTSQERMMADREAMRTLIEQAYAARGRGDINGIMSAFHADGMFELKGERQSLELAGAVKGHANIREAMIGFAATFEFADREILGMIIEGDNACVHSRLQITYAPKNESFTTELVDLFKFKDGKIAELVEFADTALIKQITS